MGLKKISLDKNKIRLSTETEHWLFKRIVEERNQNRDLKRTIDDLKSQIDDQQELLKFLADNLCTNMGISAPSDNDCTDEESSLSDQEGPCVDCGRKNIKKKKLSASSDKSNQDENKSKE